MGTRDVDAARTRTEPDAPGREGLGPWLDRNADVQLVTFEEAVARADVVVNATAGAASIVALRAAGETKLGSKIVVDIANPLDFSSGSLHLTVGITDSLGETIQRTFPNARVVKTLNTVTAAVIVDPGSVPSGDHTILVAANDDAAKADVTELLGEFGWCDIPDLGDVSTSRGPEASLIV